MAARHGGVFAGLQDLIPPALESVTAGRDDVVAVALFTDSDARTLQPAALSRGRLAELRAESPDYAVLYAWDPDEWDLLPGQGDRNDLNSVMAKVAALAEDVDEAQWESFLLLAFNWMVEGMKNLAKKGSSTPPTRAPTWRSGSPTPASTARTSVVGLRPRTELGAAPPPTSALS